MKTRTGDHKVLSDMENLELSLKKVQSLLEVLRNYANLAAVCIFDHEILKMKGRKSRRR